MVGSTTTPLQWTSARPTRRPPVTVPCARVFRVRTSVRPIPLNMTESLWLLGSTNPHCTAERVTRIVVAVLAAHAIIEAGLHRNTRGDLGRSTHEGEIGVGKGHRSPCCACAVTRTGSVEATRHSAEPLHLGYLAVEG